MPVLIVTRAIDRRPSENYYKRIARRKKLFLPGLNKGQHREIEVCGTRRVQVIVAEVVSCGRDKQNNVLLLHGNCVGQSLREWGASPAIVIWHNIQAAVLQRLHEVQARNRVRSCARSVLVEELAYLRTISFPKGLSILTVTVPDDLA